MFSARPGRRVLAAPVLAVALAVGTPSPLVAQEPDGRTPRVAADLSLGEIDFPVTATVPEARREFELGVLALHSFWYREALEHFRRARELEPGLAMAYWGEAMAHDRPFWALPPDTVAARDVLAELEAAEDEGTVPSGLTERERAYLETARDPMGFQLPMLAALTRASYVVEARAAGLADDAVETGVDPEIADRLLEVNPAVAGFLPLTVARVATGARLASALESARAMVAGEGGGPPAGDPEELVAFLEARLALEEGDTTAALDRLGRAVELRVESGQILPQILFPMPRELRGRVLLARGRPEEARQHLANAGADRERPGLTRP